MNDLKWFIIQKDNDLLQNVFHIYSNQEVDNFIKEKEIVGFCDVINKNKQRAFLFWW